MAVISEIVTKSSVGERKFWSRSEQAKVITIFEKSIRNILTQKSTRNIAKDCVIPKSTTQRWINNYNSISAKSKLASFLETDCGLEFLKKIQVALQLLFVQQAHVGTRVISEFLELTGLSHFMASSETHQKQVRHDIQQCIIKYANEEEGRLTDMNEPKEIFAILDETFYNKKPWLVAMDAISGYLLLENQADIYTSSSWKNALEPRVKKLNGRILQVISDRGSALVSLAENVFDAHSSPDLFHVVRDIGRGMLRYIGGLVHGYCEKIADLEVMRRKDRLSLSDEEELVNLEKQKEEMEGNLTEAKEAIKEFSNSYHLFNIYTGAENKASTIEITLKATILKVKKIAIKCNVPKVFQEGIKKAGRVIPQMVETILYSSKYMQAIFSEAKCGSFERYLIREYLSPIAYLNKVAEKSSSKEKARIHNVIVALKDTGASKTKNITPERLAELEAAAVKISDVFQRSSSAVEGRNGQLSLRHHALHSVTQDTLNVLTILHNYLSVREDGTTAAERFFRKKPRPLFEYLVENAEFPARPRLRVPKAA